MPDPASPRLTVALVEDDIAFQNSFAAAIGNTDDMTFVDTARNVAQAKAMLDRHPLDVLVADLGLPDGSGSRRSAPPMPPARMRDHG
jgi:response regulator of citrate/malate metabolism